MIKDALKLTLITLVAGLLLGGVYEITKEPRAKQQQIAQDNAYMAVYKNNKEFSKDRDVSAMTFENYDLKNLKNLNEKLKDLGYNDKATVNGAVKALDKEGEIVGFVINVTATGGYGGDITYSVGFANDGTITGISILSISETPGLGMEAKEDTYLNQYVDKDGFFGINKDNPSKDKDSIDAISGATITSRAMTDGVNAAVVAFNCIDYSSFDNAEETFASTEAESSSDEASSETETTGGEAANE